MGGPSVPWDKYDHLLGKLTDTQISELVGCSVSAVGLRRRKLGIQKKKTDRLNWAKWDTYLGTMPDADLAARMHASQTAVFQRRQTKGIQPYWESHRPDPSVRRILISLTADMLQYVESERQRRNLRHLARVVVEVLREARDSA